MLFAVTAEFASGPLVARYTPDSTETRQPARPDLVALDTSGARKVPRSWLTPPMAGAVDLTVIGDSFAFGTGVARHEAFPSLLPDLLASWGEVTVSNLACPGLDLRREAAVHDFLVVPHRPDVLVWTWVPNDHDFAMPASAGTTDFIGDAFASTWAERPSNLWSLAELTLGRAMLHRGSEAEYHRSLSREAGVDDQLDHTLGPRIAAQTDAGGRFIVVMFPLMHELGSYPFAAEHARIGARLEALGAEVLDLRHAFAGLDETELWVSARDHHPDARGHAIAADAIAAAIRSGPVPSAGAAGCEFLEGDGSLGGSAAARLELCRTGDEASQVVAAERLVACELGELPQEQCLDGARTLLPYGFTRRTAEAVTDPELRARAQRALESLEAAYAAP